MRRTTLLLLAIFATVLLAACSSDGGGSSTATTSTAAAGSGGASDDPRSAQVRQLVEGAIDQLDLQSAVVGVWDGDEQVYLGAVDAPAPMAPTAVDARVRVGQPMEAMLGTVLLQLGDEGVLDLDAPVAGVLPDLVDGSSITPRMLTNNTSGTPDYMPDDEFVDAVYANPFRRWTVDELLAYAQKAPPLFAPGTDWSYSHTQVALLGHVLEEATGQTVAELLAERVFEPLGMDTAEAGTTNAIGAPAFHAFTDERDVYEESTMWNPTWALHSGTMYASVADVGRWLRALNTGELLSDEAFAEQMAPTTAGLGQLTDERYFSYGSVALGGWLVGNPSLQGYMGLSAQLRDPSVTIVVYSTPSVDRTATDNASVALGTQIAQLIAPDHPLSL